MQKELVSRGETREIMGLKLTPVVKSTLTWAEIGGVVSFYAYREPAYLLVESQMDVVALRTNGEQITLQQVCFECPSIREGLVADYSGLLTPGH